MNFIVIDLSDFHSLFHLQPLSKFQNKILLVNGLIKELRQVKVIMDLTEERAIFIKQFQFMK